MFPVLHMFPVYLQNNFYICKAAWVPLIICKATLELLNKIKINEENITSDVLKFKYNHFICDCSTTVL